MGDLDKAEAASAASTFRAPCKVVNAILHRLRRLIHHV
jgi:hypothetical protein